MLTRNISLTSVVMLSKMQLEMGIRLGYQQPCSVMSLVGPQAQHCASSAESSVPATVAALISSFPRKETWIIYLAN